MKMNKLAAGALALALGLGAVAPAVAAEGRTGRSFIELSYNEKINEVQKLYDAKEADRKDLAEAVKALDKADALVKTTKKAYDDASKASSETLPATVAAAEAAVKTAKENLQKEADKLNKIFDKKKNPEDDSDLDTDAKFEAALKKAKEEYNKKEIAYAEAQANYTKKVAEEKMGGADINLSPKAKAWNEYQKALVMQREAINRKMRADRKYNGEVDDKGRYTAKVDGSREEYEEALRDLMNYASGANAIVTLEGGKVVVKPAKEEGKKSVAEAVKALKASIDDNKAAVKSAEFLLQNAPKSVAKVKAKLEAQIATAKAAIAKGEAALAKVEKKAAFVAVAYADEDVKVEDLEALTKENKDSAADINNTIKDNEKEQPAVEEEKKPEEKKPEENKPARKAGKNAKTGIAGIAGVAGILAAASVAYAASKRD